MDTKKKRGRPKKTQSKTTPVKKKKGSAEELVLQLPFSMAEMFGDVVEEKTEIKTNSAKETANIFTITDLSGDESSDDFTKKNELYDKINNLENVVQKLTHELSHYKTLIGDNLLSKLDERKLTMMKLPIVHTDGNKYYVDDCTDVHCFWDTKPFDTPPWFLPLDYNNGVYTVTKCFCSPECMAAYNIHRMNDYRVDARYSLIKQICNEVFGSNGMEIIPAPDPEGTLNCFGGPYTIDEFRNLSRVCKKECRVIMPPMASIVPAVEESYSNFAFNRRVKPDNTGLVWKRNKPLPNDKKNINTMLGIKKKRRR